MSEKKEVEEEEEMGAPLYMMSFGDMMTNLLCFFILLCAFASEKRAGFITDGVVSIRNALQSHGLPGVLQGDKSPLDLGADRVLFRPAKSISPRMLVDKDGRISDANRDALREVLIDALEKPGVSEIAAPMVFMPGSAALSSQHQTALSFIAPRLAAYPDARIRVEGFAWKEGIGDKREWPLANERADNVARFLAEAGDIPLRRFVPIGYGPMSAASGGTESSKQDSYGRRMVLISVVGK